MNNELTNQLLTALDALGLPGELAGTRDYLHRGSEITEARYAGGEHARTARAGLASRVASGELTLADAVTQATAGDPWITIGTNHDEPVAGQLATAATAELVRMASSALRADAADLYRTLAARAGTAVEHAVAAAGVAVDMPSIVNAVRPLVYDSEDAIRHRSSDDVLYAGDVPAKMGVPSSAEIHADSRRSAAWNAAADATQEFRDVHRAAQMLREITSNRAAGQTVYGVSLPVDALRIIEMMPAPLRLAVTAGLGWAPGLYGLELFGPVKVEPRPSTGARVLAVAAAAIRKAS